MSEGWGKNMLRISKPQFTKKQKHVDEKKHEKTTTTTNISESICYP